MSNISLTFVLKTTCYLYRNDNFLKNLENENKIFEFYTCKPFSTNSLIYIDLDENIDKFFILAYDHDNIESNKNFYHNYSIKQSFERQLAYSIDGKVLCFIDNKFILKNRYDIDDKFIVFFSIDIPNIKLV
jgi:hypothetical protein